MSSLEFTPRWRPPIVGNQEEVRIMAAAFAPKATILLPQIQRPWASERQL